MKFIEDVLGSGDAFLKAVPRGASLGFNKYPQAAFAALLLQQMGDPRPYDELYELALKSEKGIKEKTRNEFPVSNFAGELAGASLLPWKAPKGNPLKAASYVAPATVAGSAALGAGYGALAGYGNSDEQSGGEKTLDALKGAGVGALLGGGTQYLQNLPVVQKGAEKVKKAFSKNPESVNSLMTDPATSAVPEAQALMSKYGVPLTRGEQTLLPEHLINEEMALRGWEGLTQMEAGKAFQQQQKESFERAVREKVENALAGLKPDEQGFISKGENATEAIKGLQQQAKADDKLVREAYKLAPTQDVVFDINTIKNFPKNVEPALQDAYGATRQTAPNTYAQLDAFKQIFNQNLNKQGEQITGASLKALDGWVKGLNMARSNNMNNIDKASLGVLKKEYDNFVDNLFENALLSGDKSILENLNKAKNMKREWYKKYTSNNPDDVGQNFIDEMVSYGLNNTPLTPEQVVNKMFGMSEMGFGPQAGAVAQKLKSTLSPEGFNQTKLEFLNRVLTPLKSERPQAGVYLRNLQRLEKQQPTLMKTYLNKNELNELKDIGKLAARIYTRPVNRMNPSGTAEFMGKITKLISSVPVVGQAFDLGSMIVKSANRHKTSFNPRQIEDQVRYGQKQLTPFNKALTIEEINSND